MSTAAQPPFWGPDPPEFHPKFLVKIVMSKLHFLFIWGKFNNAYFVVVPGERVMGGVQGLGLGVEVGLCCKCGAAVTPLNAVVLVVIGELTWAHFLTSRVLGRHHYVGGRGGVGSLPPPAALGSGGSGMNTFVTYNGHSSLLLLCMILLACLIVIVVVAIIVIVVVTVPSTKDDKNHCGRQWGLGMHRLLLQRAPRPQRLVGHTVVDVRNARKTYPALALLPHSFPGGGQRWCRRQW